ncbi:MAG: PQQ-binding-like beta-propeller repeat protein [Fidelibacterota bacterium]|nr:MAG: PQQ-binding-like beta-propeller repeat protein [Candidatus Neomarinimicrobiota bacterium]
MRTFPSNILPPIGMILLCLLTGCGRGPKIHPDEITSSALPHSLTGTPETAWQAKLPSPPSALLPLGPKVLLITSHRGEVYQLELQEGQRTTPVRQPLRKSITSTLMPRGESRLYIASARDGELRAYDLIRGRTAWKQEAAGITGPLALAEGLLIAASTTGEITAFDTTEGRLIWRRQLPGRIHQGVWMVDDLALVLNDKGTLYAFKPRQESSGDETLQNHYPFEWQWELAVRPNAVVAANRDRLVVGDSDGRLVAVDPATRESSFEIQLDAPIHSRPAVTSDRVVVATAAGEILAFQLNDGSPVWQVQGEGLVKHPLLGTEGPAPQSILIPFARGQLLALEHATGHELWRYDMERPIELVSITPEGVVATNRRNQIVYLRLVNSAAPMGK